MDISTPVGLVLCALTVLFGIYMGGTYLIFIDIPSIFIVLGGGVMAAPLVAFPIPVIKGMLKVVLKTIYVSSYNSQDTIKFIVELAQKARKESLLALENVEITDPFLKKGITLAVDGTEPGTIKAILTAEMTYIKKRHEMGVGFLKFLTESAPAFGMIGTLVGLVSMLANLSDPAAIGPSMAVAILTTLYGALVANVIAGPLAKKLEYYDGLEMMQMEIILEGINSILEGDHPAIAEQKLMSFLPAGQRTSAGGK